jgi:hypothetical protein
VPLRLAYRGVTNAFALLRLLPMSDRDTDVEILALRHRRAVLQRQLGTEKVRFDATDRAFLAALLHRLPRTVLRRGRLLMRPDAVLRWHGDLLAPPPRAPVPAETARPARLPPTRSCPCLCVPMHRLRRRWAYILILF